MTWVKPEECEYHNKPFKEVKLEDGTTAKITKSVLTGQPLLSVYRDTYQSFTSLPIHNCPFCGAALPAKPLKYEPDKWKNQHGFYGLAKPAIYWELGQGHNVYSEYAMQNVSKHLGYANALLAQYTGDKPYGVK